METFETARTPLVVGSYRLTAVRSRHADCEVWSALHMPTEMEVVMEIYAKSGDDKRLIEAVVRKIDLFVDLAGKKVLRLLEVIDVDEAVFLAYENYGSQSLQQYVVNCPPSGREFQRLVRSLIKIVRGLHRRCFFHGTLNANSFVLTPQKKLKFKDAPSCNTFLRSRDEPARFDAILSKASDVWSIGTLIYRMIHHQLSEGALQTVTEEGSGPDAVPEIVARLDPDLSDLLTRMTDQNPAARISTAECLRHPYLTRSEPTLLMGGALWGDRDDRRSDSSSGGPINLDVVRFLARATGAPEADLAASAAANDLSSWCAAYWLLKQRLAAGRGYPALDGQLGADFYNEPETRNFTKTPRNSIAPVALEETADAAVKKTSSKATKSRKTIRGEATTTRESDTGYRSTVALLRSRRLGLNETSRGVTADKTETSTTSAAHVRRNKLQQSQRELESLPPISVRSAGNSDLTQSSRHQPHLQLQLPVKKQQKQSLTSRYLSYMRRQELAAAAAAAAGAKSAAAAEPLDDGEAASNQPQSRGTSDTIRVRVVRQRRKPAAGPAATDHPTATMPTLSPRQPPNSRNELARQHPADSLLDEADEEVGDAFLTAETQYLWENAIVRWPEWVESTRVV